MAKCMCFIKTLMHVYRELTHIMFRISAKEFLDKFYSIKTESDINKADTKTEGKRLINPLRPGQKKYHFDFFFNKSQLFIIHTCGYPVNSRSFCPIMDIHKRSFCPIMDIHKSWIFPHKINPHLHTLTQLWVCFIIKTVFLGLGIPIKKLRDMMGISKEIRQHFYNETWISNHIHYKVWDK